jgi:HAD superfamily hydrolase (TIGR01509 family)
MTKFIYFDVGNVFHTFGHIYETAAKDFNISPDDIGNLFDKYDDQITKGCINATDFWHKCCLELNLKNGFNYDFVHSWVHDYVNIPSVHKLTKELVKKYKVGIFSNHYIGTFAESLSQEKIPKINYSAVVVSAEVGFRKPQPEIYQIAEEKCGFTGSDIFFIDDKQINLNEATRHSWQTFLFDPKHPEESVDNLRSILL